MVSFHDTFLAAIERFLSESGMTPTEFGKLAAKDSHFVADLRNGRSCGRRLTDRVTSWMASYKSEKAA